MKLHLLFLTFNTGHQSHPRMSPASLRALWLSQFTGSHNGAGLRMVFLTADHGIWFNPVRLRNGLHCGV